MKDEEEKKDFLINEGNMTQLGFSEEVKQYVRERQNIFRKIRKEKEEIENLEKEYEMRRESSILFQLQQVNRNLDAQIDKLVDIRLKNIEFEIFMKSIGKNLSIIKSETSYFETLFRDILYYIKIFGTLIIILLIILIIVNL
jgi:hypothetical protein